MEVDPQPPPQQQQQPVADAEQLESIVAAAHDLLISSLAAGEQPTADGAELDAQIAAYRASISRLAGHLGPDATAGLAAPTTSDVAGGQDQSSKQQLSSAAAAAAAGGGADQAEGTVAGLGREGVDYTVSAARLLLQLSMTGCLNPTCASTPHSHVLLQTLPQTPVLCCVVSVCYCVLCCCCNTIKHNRLAVWRTSIPQSGRCPPTAYPSTPT